MAKKEIIRKGYLTKLRRGLGDTDVVKIVTGMRRCGKSTLLKQYADSLMQDGIPSDRILMINFESNEMEDVTNHKELNAWLKEKMSDKRTYVFLDEIQRVDGWERSVNSLLVDYDADIYVTGSNAYLLSSDLSTYLSGRYVEISMLPLSFSEFLEMTPVSEKEDVYFRFDQFMKLGAIPAVNIENDDEYIQDYLLGIYNTIVRRDIETRIGISNQASFEKVIRYVMSNVGNITSANSIAGAAGMNQVTIAKYLRALEDAFLVYRVDRFDVKGKKILKSLEKYYASDTGLRNAALRTKGGGDTGRLLENVVFLELIRRGYEIRVGSYRDREIDFAATKNGGTEYYQVTTSMLQESVFDRETGSLLAVDDNFPKTVLSLDRPAFPLGKGLIHKNVIDWLLEK